MNLRDKAREIYDRGLSERGDFTPRGVPLNIYRYWANLPNTLPPVRENFCHFWRVVVIWAPLNWLVENNKKFAMTIGAVALFLVGLAFALNSIVPLVPVISVYIITGFIIGFENASKRLRGSEVSKAARNTFIITFPASIITFLLGSINLSDETFKRLAQVVGGLGVIGTIFFAGWAIVSAGIGEFFIFLEVLFGAVMLIVAVIGLTSILCDMFASFGDRRKKKKDNRSKIVSGAADFAALGVNIIRVKKWKICPLVTIPEKDLTDAGR